MHNIINKIAGFPCDSDYRKTCSTASENGIKDICMGRVLNSPHKITFKRQGELDVFLDVACFLRNCPLTYKCMPTRTISQNIPAFLDTLNCAKNLLYRKQKMHSAKSAFCYSPLYFIMLRP